MTDRLSQRAAAVLALGAIYALAADLGLRVEPVSGFASLIWAPTGIALAALLIGGFHLWPGIAVGACAVNALHGAGFLAACGIALGNTLEAVIGTWLLRKCGFRIGIERLRDCAALVLLAAGLSTILSATLGVVSLHLSGKVAWSDLDVTWLAWWLGDMLGALIVAPPLLVWRTPAPVVRKRGFLEAGLLASSAAVCSLFAIGVLQLDWMMQLPRSYLLFPFVVWAGLRFGQHGGVLVTLLVSASMVGCTLLGKGVFGSESVVRGLFHLHMLLVVLSTTSLAIAAIATERGRARRERMRLEEALRQKLEELALADRRKDEFLATLAHELRNPLAPLTFALELLRRSDSDGRVVRETHEMMGRQVRRLVRLIDDLLDVSRITSGKLTMRREVVNLADLVQGAVEQVRPLAESAGHEVLVSLPEAPILLEADPLRIAQVFTNLLDNAVKYTERGGRIQLSAEREDGAIVVSVSDNGLGIPASMLPRVFDMFAQVDRSLERRSGGLGIGLTLVRKIVDLHGGTVEGRSAGLGHGSEFRVRLPVLSTVLQPEAEERLEPQENASIPEVRRILVVDDNEDAAISLSILLRRRGHEVRTGHDGLRAVEIAHDFVPDVALLDIGMPNLSGYEVARRLRSVFGARMLLIAISGWGREEDQLRSKEAGFDHHLVKPVDFAGLEGLLASRNVLRADVLDRNA